MRVTFNANSCTPFKRVLRAAPLATLAVALGGFTARADITVTVQATTDIWLAGQPSGSGVTGYFGPDTAPDNSPVGISGVTAGSIITFSATGSTSVDTSCFAGPDGGCYGDQSSFSPSPADAAYNGPADALIGVFLNSTAGPPAINSSGVPTGFVSGLDYQINANMGLGSYSPTLNQIFFIGDGLTGTGTGSTQDFYVPTGATTLYLAVADSVGGSTGNDGSLKVGVQGEGLTLVPEPGAMLLLALQLSAVLCVLLTLRRRAAR